MIFSYDWRLAASMLICIPLCYVVGVIAGRVYFKVSNRIQGRLSDMTRYFSAVLPYITLVKLFGQEDREQQNGNAWIGQYFRTSMQNSVYGLAIAFANSITSLAQTLVIIFVGLWLLNEGTIDIGQWIAFYAYAQMLNGGFSSIMSMWQSIKRNQGACARISAATDEAPEENKGTVDAQNVRGDLAFKDVSFAYEDKNVLNDVSFTAEQGRVTAIVGPSGAGKSTILNLVERFYLPGQGVVTLAGRNAQDYELTSWRRNIGYIPQDTQLLAGTIRDNIAHGAVGQVSREKLEEAARQADILDYIQSLPQGFDTQVGENGAKLSGGQKQRIALARMMIRDPEYLLLDEATSSLDAENERQITEALSQLMAGRTSVVVAHNLRTIKNADNIVFMENGRVKAQGTHQQLYDTDPTYRRYVDLQHV